MSFRFPTAKQMYNREKIYLHKDHGDKDCLDKIMNRRYYINDRHLTEYNVKCNNLSWKFNNFLKDKGYVVEKTPQQNEPFQETVSWRNS